MHSPGSNKSTLNKLGLTEKRQLMAVLLRAKLNAARSFPLSFAQEQLWFMEQLEPGTATYNIPLYIPLQGPVDSAIVQQVLYFLAKRHDMLRARFAVLDDKPVQIIEPQADIRLEYEDLSSLTPEQRNAGLSQLLNIEVQQPFDLTQGCIRYKFIKIDQLNSLLCITMHHIITDGWSLGLYTNEFNTLLHAYRKDRQAQPLQPLNLEYTDYARWQREYLQGMRLQKLIQFWVQHLAGVQSILDLPTDFIRPALQTFNGSVVDFSFTQELSEKLIDSAHQHNVTMYMMLLACFYTLLYRYSGQEDIVVGAPVVNRSRPEFEPLMGLFVNSVIFRVNIAEQTTFRDLLSQVRNTSLEAFEHQALPFDTLLNELNIERVPGYSPLYQVVFNFQNPSLIETADTGRDSSASSFNLVHSNTAKVDLNLAVGQKDNKIFGGMEYNTDLFTEQTVRLMLSHFEMIARFVAREPTTQLLDIPLESATETNTSESVRHNKETKQSPGNKTIFEDAFSFEKSITSESDSLGPGNKAT